MRESIISTMSSLSSGSWLAEIPLQIPASMRLIYSVLGAVLLIAAIIDILWTTLWVDGGSGPSRPD